MTTFSEVVDAYVAERRAVGLKMRRAEMRMAGICALHNFRYVRTNIKARPSWPSASHTR